MISAELIDLGSKNCPFSTQLHSKKWFDHKIVLPWSRILFAIVYLCGEKQSHVSAPAAAAVCRLQYNVLLLTQHQCTFVVISTALDCLILNSWLQSSRSLRDPPHSHQVRWQGRYIDRWYTRPSLSGEAKTVPGPRAVWPRPGQGEEAGRRGRDAPQTLRIRGTYLSQPHINIVHMITFGYAGKNKERLSNCS